MSLYDGIESGKEKEKGTLGHVAGWSSGIKLLQSQLQLKKAALTQVKKEPNRKGAVLLPVVDLKARKDEGDDMLPPSAHHGYNSSRGRNSVGENQNSPENENKPPNSNTSLFGADPEWNLKDEYDPMWPNDYEKIIKERRDKKEKEREEDRRRDYEERERRRRERYNRNDRMEEEPREREREPREPRRRRGGGGGGGPGPENEEEDDGRPPRRGAKRSYKNYDNEESSKGSMGAAIAPPPSLMEDDFMPPIAQRFTGAGFAPSLGGSVAAKIMAKYGYKEGQGLGRMEQGMSQALQVEKTSKRGGKIIHEKDIPKASAPPPDVSPPSPELSGDPAQAESITEAMKNPSKVVLLRNMVGPGEVDEDLEPEVKEECSKYGDILKCLIFEISDCCEEEAVRIFVEFKRIESAIKAVVDLNGRFFGGRIVKAGFYNLDKFRRLDLVE